MVPISNRLFFVFLEWDQYSSSPLRYLSARDVARLSEVCSSTQKLLTERRISHIRSWTGEATISKEQAQRVDIFIQALIYAQFPFPRDRPPFKLFASGNFAYLDPFLEEEGFTWEPKVRYDLARRLILAGDRDLALRTAARLIEFDDASPTCKIARAFLQEIELFKVLKVDDDFYATVWTHPTAAILEAFERNSLYELFMMKPLIVAMQRKLNYTREVLPQFANALLDPEGFISLDPEALLQKVIDEFDPESMDAHFIEVLLQICRGLDMHFEGYAFSLALQTRELAKVELTLNCLLAADQVPTNDALRLARHHECSNSILTLIRSHIPQPAEQSRKRKSPPE